MSRLARRYSLREEWKIRDGISGFFPASLHPDLAFHAVASDSGKLSGPFRVGGGYSIFKVLGVRQTADSVRDRLPAIREQIREQLLELKVQRKLDGFISSCAVREGVTLREDLLRGIDVTPSSMITWRYIGFGGRINAVPALIEQTGWIDRWRGAKIRNGGVLP